ncbi:hypothetical protein NX722_06510 [Endozoicomonas gorgoniicola]|uniref:Uncharacterized protein n=1 Tax=Endozoicomonas gorgoniicola TaxID=1234144 RepID=A0ABT3MSE6_9GAMM|nr:hypothetical protein [Endozoicomonas gorgoniicola]MCW7552306.1 hypothetical protein [Endozoicomonas gorgoniicola]
MSSNKNRVVFFDLEYYVPEDLRQNKGLAYNPWRKDNLFLGGCFLNASAATDLHDAFDDFSIKVDSFWLWNYPSESDLVYSVYRYLLDIFHDVQSRGDDRISPLLCGVGITHSDWPVLLDLFRKHRILDNAEAFEFQQQFRSLDLSQLVVGFCNNATNFLYPKPKNTIFGKYTPDIQFASGKEVWDLYDQQKHLTIEKRVIEEIACTHESYVSILEDIRYLKSLERADKALKSKYSA